MKNLLIVFACLGISLAKPTQNNEVQDFQNHPPVETDESPQENTKEDESVGLQESRYEYEFLPNSELTVLEIEPETAASHDDHDHHHKPKTGYSAGGSLVNIAQGAAQAAHISLGNQPAAAGQAAYVAKNRLAQSAAQSAATAAAALAGKQIILRGLEQQTYNAHRALESEKLQLQQAQRAATAAANAASQARHQVQVITTALNAAQATSEHASQAAAEAAAELAAQTTMVGAAKARLDALEDQLHVAKVDFEATQSAANKAAHAAQTAQSNAAAAAAHAAEVANHGHHHHHHHHHKPHHKDHHEQHNLEDHDNNETIVLQIPAEQAVAHATETPGIATETFEGFDNYESYQY